MAKKKESGTDLSSKLTPRENDSPQENRPGPVIPKATIRLHTYVTHQLFFGRKTDESRTGRDVCFTLFAANTNTLWDCAIADDPYADARLIQIEDKLQVVRSKVDTVSKAVSELLGSMESSGIRVDNHQSIRPVDVPIVFRTVHASVAIQILGSIDTLIQKALMARHFALVTDQDWQRIREESVSPMRHLFSLAQFRSSGATRDDFAATNARARAAIEKLGQLPDDILQGLRRPALGPRPHKSLLFGGTAVTDNNGTEDSLVAQSLKALDQKLNPMAVASVPTALDNVTPLAPIETAPTGETETADDATETAPARKMRGRRE